LKPGKRKVDTTAAFHLIRRRVCDCEAA